jgi:hypothetical protein
MEQKIYHSKIDSWIAVVLIGAMAFSVYIVLIALRTGSIAAILSAVPAAIIGVGLPLWLMKSTRYELDDCKLLVKCGPFKWTIAISEITTITPTSNPLSSPALSLNRIRIDYGTDKSLMISPKLESQFIDDIERRRKICG